MSLLRSAQLHARQGVRLFDCRHSLTDPDLGLAAYAAGHIPGALHAHIDRDLSGRASGTNGRHPLPARQAFIGWLERAGVTSGDSIVVYDDVGGAFAARLWWLLRWAGHGDVAILDGGFQAWQAAGQRLETRTPSFATSTYPDAGSGQSTVDADAVLRNITAPAFQLVDARAASRFAGQGETIDPVGGHIPGAANRPFADNLDADGFFRPISALKADFLALIGDRTPQEVVHQCGSGVTACHNLFAMELAGLPGSRLYPGSWSEWCADAARPMVRAPQD